MTQNTPPSPDPSLPAKTPLDIEGVVYTAVFNPYDGRKNWIDMLTTFCWAFRDTEDATLILKLTHRDNSVAMVAFKECLYRLTPFKCRIVAIQGFLSDHDYEQLTAVTTYCLNVSHGEGQCLPLMEFMSYGIPAVSPRHTGMADYIDESVAFVPKATLEPTRWPTDDARNAYRTQRYRLDWESIVDALRESYRVAKEDRARYEAMSKASVIRLKQHCSRAVVQEKLRDFLSQDRRVFRSFPDKATS